MKYFSMFSGIGGFELGIQQAISNRILGNRQQPTEKIDIRQEQDITDSTGELGNGGWKCAECIGYSEIDKYADQIYQKQFGGKNYGDATKINARELPDFELLVGGFPCQAFSIAGKRAGFDDTRGTLFFDIARILNEKRPRHLVLENVKGLLSHDSGKTFQTILGVLADLGYFVEWQVLNSKDFGVPQNRERVFIVGHLGGEPRRKVFPITGTNGKDIEQLNQPKHSNDRVYGEDGISPTLNTMQGGNRQPFVKVPEATSKGYAEAEIGDSINLSVPNSKTRRGRVGKGIAQTIGTGMHQHTLSSDMQIRRLTPLECERLQGFPDRWTEGLSDTQRYKTLGNAVTVNVVAAVIKELING